MKLATVVGARPQLVKAARISATIRKSVEEILIHTGQHYDYGMSESFFQELEIPQPNYNLGIGSGKQAEQTALMMIKLEEVFLKEIPEAVLVYGDTNSTLAAAVTAAKLHIPIIHVEAGLRSFNRWMPEEINRVLTDHVSELLFCPTEAAIQHLKKEGITKGVYHVGDVMCDSVLFYKGRLEQKRKEDFFKSLEPVFGDSIPCLDLWYLATIHRAENTMSSKELATILSALQELPHPVIFSVHPRIKKFIVDICAERPLSNLIFVSPMKYLDMLYFTKNAVKVATDSGGLQKECYLLGTPCVTIREQTEWEETLIGNNNILALRDKKDILNKMVNILVDTTNHPSFYGNGSAADEICQVIIKHFDKQLNP